MEVFQYSGLGVWGEIVVVIVVINIYKNYLGYMYFVLFIIFMMVVFVIVISYFIGRFIEEQVFLYNIFFDYVVNWKNSLL